MCRIYGHLDAAVSPHDLRLASALQRHGGPDAQSRLCGATWALGNNRLAIVDLEGGHQPYDLDGAIHAVFNGEIYNHDELRRDLESHGYRFADRCDGSIIPALYAQYGLSFADRIEGMYAIAVLDRRADPKLVLVTDQVGMKPIYYHWDPKLRRICFASEIPALLALGGLDRSPWLPGLDAYLATKTPFGDRTMFEAVRVLPPAATAVVDRLHGFAIHRRAALVPSVTTTTNMETASEQLRGLLDREVSRLLQSDVPVSVVTSGGLDSSLVTTLAARSHPGIHSFNIAYRGSWPSDERQYARLVSERAGTTHHQVEVDPACFPTLLPEVVWHLGQPNADPITLSTYALFQAVRAAGFKVALTGDAADELFGGYDRIKAALSEPDGVDWAANYVESLAAVPRQVRWRLYTDDYRALIREQGETSDWIARQLRDSPLSRLDALTEVETGWRLPAYHLRRVDHLSMAHSVEVRLPFCQPQVVGFARALPGGLRVRGVEGKRVLYAAATGDLPEAILRRPKQPFTLPIAAMLVPGQPLFEFASDVLSAPALRRHGFLDPAAVGHVLAQQSERPSGPAASVLWALLVFQLWLDQFGVAVPAGRLQLQEVA